MLSSKQWRSVKGFPLRLALSYLVVGAIYILVSDRVLAALVSDPAVITEIQSYKGWGFVAISAMLILCVSHTFLGSLRRTEQSLERTRLDYGRLLETTHEGVQVMDAEGRTIFVNDRLCEITGVDRSRLLADGLNGLVSPPEDASTEMGEDELRLVSPKGEEVWTIVSESAVTSDGGARTGTLRMVTDNTARRRAMMELACALKTQRVLISELDHRVRNNLASLVAMIEVSAANKPELQRFANKVTDRVRVMAAVYTVLSRSQWQPVPMAEVVRAVIGLEARCHAAGEAVSVELNQVVPLMLVLFELLSNAREHGALRSERGRVEVTWRVAPGGQVVELEWVERDGPAVDDVRPPGFGLTVAAGIAGSELRGELVWAMAAEGARARLRMAAGPGGNVQSVVGEVKQPTLAATN